jgi:mono/diheme cytochrome c family protein
VQGLVSHVGAILAVGGLVSSCTQSAPITAVERGRRVYMANCIVCHNPDPSKPGASGPVVAGASRELLEARVVHATYPAGYTPKRSTKAMVPLAYLAPRLDDLAAFLATAKAAVR